jgi:hypothetical protein
MRFGAFGVVSFDSTVLTDALSSFLDKYFQAGLWSPALGDVDAESVAVGELLFHGHFGEREPRLSPVRLN